VQSVEIFILFFFKFKGYYYLFLITSFYLEKDSKIPKNKLDKNFLAFKFLEEVCNKP
jgi:hypothetical protein